MFLEQEGPEVQQGLGTGCSQSTPSRSGGVFDDRMMVLMERWSCVSRKVDIVNVGS